METPEGRARLAFAPRNDLGVLDHYVTLNSGEVSYVPLRVIADGTAAEVVLTLRRRKGMTDDEFKADAAAVPADLAASSTSSRTRQNPPGELTGKLFSSGK